MTVQFVTIHLYNHEGTQWKRLPCRFR